MSTSALIPAYQPTGVLLEVVDSVLQAGFARVLVVNDGSKTECAPLFEAVRSRPGVTLLEHAVNRGKGAALRTGLEHLHRTAPSDEVGVVTLDADGQHRAQDAWRVAEELERHPDALVLGVRSFTRKGVPWPRRIGNIFTRVVFAVLVGRVIRDTQTGLRGHPMGWIPELLTIDYDGYEYELEVLLYCRKRPLRQVTIETVYIGENESSHFNLVRDSARIYGTLVRSRLRALRDWLKKRAP